MSLPSRGQVYAFLEPLRGRSATFIIADRMTDLAVSRFILGCFATLRIQATLVDTSCFYGTNIEKLTSGLPKEFMQRCTLQFLSENTTNEESLANTFTTTSSALLIDDLNALLHLLSSRGQRFGVHRLSTFFHMLSYGARLNKLFVLGMVYKTRFGNVSTRGQRSLSQVSDLQVATELRTNGEVAFRCGGIAEWPADGFRAMPSLRA